MNKERKILIWLSKRDYCESVKTMAFCSIGIKNKRDNTPFCVSGLNQCLLLTKEVPEVLESFKEIAAISPRWSTIIKHWDSLVSSLIQETGDNFKKSNYAPLTTSLLSDIRLGKIT